MLYQLSYVSTGFCEDARAEYSRPDHRQSAIRFDSISLAIRKGVRGSPLSFRSAELLPRTDLERSFDPAGGVASDPTDSPRKESRFVTTRIVVARLR